MSLALLPLSMRRGRDALSPRYVLQPPVGRALTGSTLPIGREGTLRTPRTRGQG